jgi:hypothetical protein
VRTLVSHLVAVAVTLHTLLGCCWHHAHEPVATVAQVETAQSETKAPVPVKSCRCHRHQAREFAKQEQNRPTRQEPVDRCPNTCGDKCVYVSTDRVQLDHPLILTSFDLTPAAPQSDLAMGLSISRYESDDATVDPPPLRLHLLYQLLLI